MHRSTQADLEPRQSRESTLNPKPQQQGSPHIKKQVFRNDLQATEVNNKEVSLSAGKEHSGPRKGGHSSSGHGDPVTVTPPAGSAFTLRPQHLDSLTLSTSDT